MQNPYQRSSPLWTESCAASSDRRLPPGDASQSLFCSSTRRAFQLPVKNATTMRRNQNRDGAGGSVSDRRVTVGHLSSVQPGGGSLPSSQSRTYPFGPGLAEDPIVVVASWCNATKPRHV